MAGLAFVPFNPHSGSSFAGLAAGVPDTDKSRGCPWREKGLGPAGRRCPNISL